MCSYKITGTVLLTVILGLIWNVPGQSQQHPAAVQIVTNSHRALFYSGDDFKARVFMRLISKQGKERVRELTMLRKDFGENGNQKYFMYFHQPADVHDMTFMVWKYPQKDDDRWLFIPAIKLVRRIAANDKRSSFVGSDFTYEDVSGREIEEDTHTLLREEELDGRPAYVVKSVPKEENSADYSSKISWIETGNFLPLKEEYYDKRGDLYKVFTAVEIKEVQGFPTIMQRRMENTKSGHRTEVTSSEVKYNVGLKDDLFSERYLRSAPREWIR